MNTVSTTDTVSPPMIARASGAYASLPSPSFMAIGRSPMMVASEVISEHHCVTVHRAYKGAVMGMRASHKLTHAGDTTHFDVSYVTKLGTQGASLAQAILQHCERDYASLQQTFGGDLLTKWALDRRHWRSYWSSLC